MNKLLQTILLSVYHVIVKTGFLSTSIGKAIFVKAYFAYKEFTEAKFVDELGTFVAPGTAVVDVGANIGFFTLKFGRWVGQNGRVIAIEPDQYNYSLLQKLIEKAKLTPRIDLVQAVAADLSGELLLEIDPFHPGNHRLGNQGIPVKAVTIDGIVAPLGMPVSLIKVDVQGAEDLVIAGAWETILQFHPVLLLEIDDGRLEDYGSSAHALITKLTELNYTTNILTSNGVAPVSLQQVIIRLKATEYLDILFIHQKDIST